MKTLEIQLPDQLAEKIAALIEAGWFTSEEELTRLALSEFLRHHGFQLQEQLQREDIQWALSVKAESSTPADLHLTRAAARTFDHCRLEGSEERGS